MHNNTKRKPFGFEMSVKLSLIACLSVFAVIFLLEIGNTEPTGSNPAKSEIKDSKTGQDHKAEQRKFIAYYFHGTHRCWSCLRIEDWSQDAIRENFSSELGEGKLIWKSVNVEKPENRHFVSDYQLYTKALVLVEMRGKNQIRWKNLEKVWRHLRNQQGFYEYVTQEVGEFMRKL